MDGNTPEGGPPRAEPYGIIMKRNNMSEQRYAPLIRSLHGSSRNHLSLAIQRGVRPSFLLEGVSVKREVDAPAYQL